MGRRSISRKALVGVGTVLGVMLWVAVAVTATFAFEREVTLPFCRETCRTAGDELERYRQYTKGGPPEACICQSGQAIRPDVLHNPIAMVLLTFGLGSVVSLRVWSQVVDARAAKRRGSIR